MPKNRKKTTQKRADTAMDRQIGQNLRRLRECAGQSQSAVAQALGITFQQYQKYENGSNRLSSSRLFILQSHFGVPYECFFEGLAKADTAQPKRRTDFMTLKIAKKVSGIKDKTTKVKIDRMIDIFCA